MLTTEELKAFVRQNNIIGYAVAMIVALTLKDLIATFIGNLLVPGLNLFFLSLQIKSFSKYLPGQEKVDALPVIKAFFTFLLTFILLYFTITTLFASWATENKKIEP